MIAIASIMIYLLSESSYATQSTVVVKGHKYLEVMQAARYVEPEDKMLVWVDINATMDCFGEPYLPADPSLYGLKWITITYASNIKESGLFWCLAEIQARNLEAVINIPWVFDISLVRVGGIETQSSRNPKLPVGLKEAIGRALLHEGRLEVIVQLEDFSGKSQNSSAVVRSRRDRIVQNVTATLETFEGKVLRDRQSFLVAALPARSLPELVKNPFVKRLSLNGPVVPLGGKPSYDFSDVDDSLHQKGLIISLLVAALWICEISDRMKQKRHWLVIALVLLLTIACSTVPSVQALNASTSTIQAPAVWATGNRGQGVNIAVIDRGFDVYHADLASAVVHCINADNWSNNVAGEEGHGTHVAGIVAGRGTNNSSFRGVAWGAGLVLIKATQNDDLAPAVRWVIDNRGQYNIRVIQSSLTPTDIGNNPILGGDGLETPYSIEMDNAVENGIVVVQAAGNAGSLGSKTIGSPGNAFNVITVGAIDDQNNDNIADDVLWEHSSRGPTGGEIGSRPKPDVVAPGVHIISARALGTNIGKPDMGDSYIDDHYVESTGTSFAAPHVSGTVALLLKANPYLTPAQVKAILRQTARLNDNLSQLTVNDRGHGIINALAAVQLAQNTSGINRYYMYDSWEVTMPSRFLDPLHLSGDYLNFTVKPPSSVHGIDVFDVHYYYWNSWPGGSEDDYRLLYQINAPHVWISGQYYHLGNDMHKYLLSGPRIYAKEAGCVLMRASYRILGVTIKYEWKMHVDEMWLKLTFLGGFNWKALFYIDPDVGGSTNRAYLPDTEETLQTERKIMDPINVDIRNEAQQDYIQIQPNSTDVPTMWILKYPYPHVGNDPDSALTGDYIVDRDIVVYYEAIAYYPDPGPVLHRKHNPPPVWNTTQNDANSGGDAGNTYENATLITPNDAYSGILCSQNPVDTDDWYQFYVGANQTIEVTMNTGAMNELDFDLELYSPNDANNSKASSHLPAGFSENISYVADCSGYWRLRNYIISDEGQYTIYLRVHSSGGPPEPPPGEPIPERIENPNL
jgi:serine protease AprX